jgi:hypothetical protein
MAEMATNQGQTRGEIVLETLSVTHMTRSPGRIAYFREEISRVVRTLYDC